MRLNKVEKAMMNNPLRSLIQRYFEAAKLLSMGGKINGKYALEVGCGRGIGIKIILELFGAKQVDAFDLDPHMVALSRRRLMKENEKVRLWQGDVTTISSEDSTYDAVFDFGIIHHVPDWRTALREIYRVLKPGGRFYAEEALKKFIDSYLWRILLDHPKEDRFDQEQFVQALVDAGFRVIATNQIGQWFAWFIADKPGTNEE